MRSMHSISLRSCSCVSVRTRRSVSVPALESRLSRSQTHAPGGHSLRMGIPEIDCNMPTPEFRLSTKNRFSLPYCHSIAGCILGTSQPAPGILHPAAAPSPHHHESHHEYPASLSAMPIRIHL